MDEVEVGHIVDLEGTSAMATPAKRKRGRPKKVPGNSQTETVSEPPKPSQVPDVPSESNRIAGRMSLRPNRRVDVRKGTRELNEVIGDDGSDGDDIPVDDNDDGDGDFKADENSESNNVSDLTNSFYLSEKNFFVVDESKDVSGSFPSKRRGKRRIAFANHRMFPYHVPSQLNGDDVVKEGENVTEKPYEFNKELLCVGCARELKPDALQGYRNIYKDLTVGGKSLYDMLCSIVKDEISGATFGSLVCHKCYNSLNQIENIYQQFRKSVDTFLDSYVLGHKTVAADLNGAKVIDEADSFTNSIDLNNCILVIVDDNLSNLNPLFVGPGRHLNCTFEHAYKGCVTDSSMIPQNCQEMAPCDGETTITITFDYSTGIIEKALSLNVTEMTKAELKSATTDGFALFYMTKTEFGSLHRYIGDKKVFISKDDASSLLANGIMLLGKKANLGPIFLSGHLATEFKQKVPSCQHPFNCLDCGSAFRNLHLLTNHVQVLHKSEDTASSTSVAISAVQGIKKMAGKLKRAAEVEQRSEGNGPTLDKPFECEFCGKCFSHYQNLSNHSDHYHGFQRSCNVDGCEHVSSSIQEFVQHYVCHADSSFVLPEEFEEKKKVVLPCPLCNIHIQGLWKFAQHTYNHDAQPRFKCPVCPKRTHKVQNFKDHLAKHLGSGYSKLRTCRYCKKEIVASELLRHIKEHHDNRHVCDVCNLAFATEAKLLFHQEKHLPRSKWQIHCEMCDNMFPSEVRLKLHLANVHGNVTLDCRDCGQSFANRNELNLHRKAEHEDVAALFQCLACNKRETNVMSARKHYRMEHKDKPFSCFKCKSVFDEEVLLHQHLTDEHPDVVGGTPATDGLADLTCIFCRKISNKFALHLRHIRFFHLVESIEVRENVAVTEDHIAEFDKDTGGVIRLHSIP